MMYLAICGSRYADAHVIGIYTTQKRAENRLDRVQGYFDYKRVEPIEINKDVCIEIE
jgi:hypothetical protein